MLAQSRAWIPASNESSESDRRHRFIFVMSGKGGDKHQHGCSLPSAGQGSRRRLVARQFCSYLRILLASALIFAVWGTGSH